MYLFLRLEFAFDCNLFFGGGEHSQISCPSLHLCALAKFQRSCEFTFIRATLTVALGIHMFKETKCDCA